MLELIAGQPGLFLSCHESLKALFKNPVITEHAAFEELGDVLFRLDRMVILDACNLREIRRSDLDGDLRDVGADLRVAREVFAELAWQVGGMHDLIADAVEELEAE